MTFQLRILFVWLTLALFGLVEWGLLAFWVPSYMRMGIPIFRRRVSGVRKKDFWLLSEKLPTMDFRSFWYPMLVFKLLGNNEIVFRHKFFSFDIGLGNQKPFRGMIRFDSTAQSITISGYFPLFEPVFFVSILLTTIYSFREFSDILQTFPFPYSSIQGRLFFTIVIFLMVRGLLAFSYYKFSNRLVEALDSMNVEEVAK